jgi:pantoate--beta-alanine ligase
MRVVRTPSDARAAARALPHPLGFVPTMGALHRGHIALIERARAENASVVASLFVNPLQFGPGEDYEKYPRAFERDARMLEEAGVAVLYAPDPERMYPPGFRTRIEVGPIGEVFEGAARPGHFGGVAVVVAKLLHAVEPTTLYVGQKDAQQAAVLEVLVRDLDMPVSVTVCETVRESDGLALSSRNAYLDQAQRRVAPGLYRALRACADAIERGQTDPACVRALAWERIEPPLEPEYLDIVDPATFVPQASIARPALIVAAVRAGRTRLLDNISLL